MSTGSTLPRADEAAKSLPRKSLPTRDELVCQIAEKILTASAQGARSIWIGRAEGYRPIGTDRRYQAPSEALKEACEVLIEKGYFLELDEQHGVHLIRVGFRPDDIGRFVDVDSLFRQEDYRHLVITDDVLKG